MGFAPADDPQIAIYVVVDRPNVAKQDEAKLATGIVRNVLTEVLPYLNIYMTEELSEDEIQELEERQLAITTQYGKPDGDDSQDGSGEDGEVSGESSEENPNEGIPPWMNYPIDPETGYRVDPENGDYLDPDTGDPVFGSFPALTE